MLVLPILFSVAFFFLLTVGSLFSIFYSIWALSMSQLVLVIYFGGMGNITIVQSKLHKYVL